MNPSYQKRCEVSMQPTKFCQWVHFLVPSHLAGAGKQFRFVSEYGKPGRSLPSVSPGRLHHSSFHIPRRNGIGCQPQRDKKEQENEPTD